MFLSLILVNGWTSTGIGSEASHFTANPPVATAVAKANKSAAIESADGSVQPVNFERFAQNENVPATQTTPPAKTPPAQPPAKPNAQADQNPSSAKPAPNLQPAPPTTPAVPTPPASTTPSIPQPPARQPLTPFSALELPPGQRPFLSRIARSPDMFGDSFIPVMADIDAGGISSNTNRNFVQTDLPLGGGMRRFKNEHARALPTDRVFFLYNHFHNALALNSQGNSTGSSVDQFTFGFEKTSEDGLWSFELRMPFSGDSDLSTDGVSVESNGVGNLVGTLKRLLYSDDSVVAAFGLAVVTPTGSDASVAFDDVRLKFENDATHLLPYLALQLTPDDDWFFHSFCQIDVAANQNDVNLRAMGVTESESLADQTLLYLDASAGYWWYRSSDDDGLTGLASVLEFHYTTTLNDADTVNLSGAIISNFENRFDVVNLTAGVHSEWNGNMAIRAAVVVPLSRDERFFDSETQVSLIRRY